MKDHVKVFWFSEQPYGYVTDADVAKYDSGRLGFPNTYLDPQKAHVLYNQYHEQYARADEVGFGRSPSWGTSSPSTTRCGWPKRSPCWTAIEAAGSSDRNDRPTRV